VRSCSKAEFARTARRNDKVSFVLQDAGLETGTVSPALGISMSRMDIGDQEQRCETDAWILVRNRDVSQKCCCGRVNSGLKKAPSRKGAWILAENHIVLQFGQDSVAVGRDFYLFESDAYLSVFNDLGGIVLQYRNILNSSLQWSALGARLGVPKRHGGVFRTRRRNIVEENAMTTENASTTTSTTNPAT
jgi:hypothetical protein